MPIGININLLSLYVYIIKYTTIILDTIELAAIFILPVNVLKKKLSRLKACSSIKTLSIALYTIDDMGIIYNKLTDSEKSKIKFVIDTCHSFTAGYDLSNKKTLKSFLDLLEKNLGINNISCFHLNDSYESLGSRKDRHQNLLLGYLSGKDSSYKNFCSFLKYGFDNNIPFILETDPCLHIAEIQLLKNMI